MRINPQLAAILAVRGAALNQTLRGLDRAIRALFEHSEKGVWYDPSDFSTLFQDSAGTTPVTAVGQAVGLVLDKSKGLVLGPEKVTNGSFDTDTTGWVRGFNSVDGVFDVSGGLARYTVGATDGAAPRMVTTVTGLTVGSYVKISFTEGTSSGGQDTLCVWTSVSNGTGGTTLNQLHNSGWNGETKTYILPVTATTMYFAFGMASATVGDVATIDNISVRELPGYHATQSTSTARPVLGSSLIDFDGVDDAVITAGGGGGTTGFFLCAAVRPDGGAGAARTIWSDAGTNTGYIVRLNASNQLELAAGNGTAYTLAATTDTLAVGTTYVVTAWDDGTNLNVQVNSGTAGTAARPVVSAGTTTATIGKDNGAATGMFNGAIYPLIYVKNGENVGAADRTAVKTYVAGKAGVTL